MIQGWICLSHYFSQWENKGYSDRQSVINLYSTPLTDNKNLEIIKSVLSTEVLIHTSKVCLLEKLEQENYCIIYLFSYLCMRDTFFMPVAQGESLSDTSVTWGDQRPFPVCLLALFVTSFLCFSWSLYKTRTYSLRFKWWRPHCQTFSEPSGISLLTTEF